MARIGHRNLLLMLLGLAGDERGLGGMTRLQKFLFLLEQEGGIVADGDEFEFEAYKAGPYSSKLYDDLEFLENLGLIASEVVGEVTAPEAAEIDALEFNDLIEQADDGHPDAYEERRFKLTDKGKTKVEDLLRNEETAPFADGIRKIKSKFGHHSLNDLLYYVYTRYPDMTTESEIRDQVLNRGRNR